MTKIGRFVLSESRSLRSSEPPCFAGSKPQAMRGSVVSPPCATARLSVAMTSACVGDPTHIVSHPRGSEGLLRISAGAVPEPDGSNRQSTEIRRNQALSGQGCAVQGHRGGQVVGALCGLIPQRGSKRIRQRLGGRGAGRVG